MDGNPEPKSQETSHRATQDAEECYVCENGEYITVNHEKYCDTCSHAPERTRDPSFVEPIEIFWMQRDNYDGDYGEERRRCIGGFIYPYVSDDGLY